MKKKHDRTVEVTQQNARAVLRRLSRDRKQKEVAALVGWAPSYYSMFMRSRSVPHQDTVEAIAKAVLNAPEP